MSKVFFLLKKPYHKGWWWFNTWWWWCSGSSVKWTWFIITCSAISMGSRFIFNSLLKIWITLGSNIFRTISVVWRHSRSATLKTHILMLTENDVIVKFGLFFRFYILLISNHTWTWTGTWKVWVWDRGDDAACKIWISSQGLSNGRPNLTGWSLKCIALLFWACRCEDRRLWRCFISF